MVKTIEAFELQVESVTLLSAEEYNHFEGYIPLLHDSWWLRSPGHFRFFSAIVTGDGLGYNYGYHVSGELGVRPALQISNLKSLQLSISDEFRVNDNAYTVISNSIVISNNLISKHPFNVYESKGNKYETSDIKRFVDKWAEGQGFADRAKEVQPTLLVIDASELQVENVTLLSAEQYKYFKDSIPLIRGAWWLCSPGDFETYSALVDGSGDVDILGSLVDKELGVRPALQSSNLKSLNLNIGNELKVNDKTYTIVSDDMVISNDLIGRHPFNYDYRKGNHYNRSDIKQFLDEWARKQGFKAKEAQPKSLDNDVLELEIENVTLLSAEEYKQFKDNIPLISDFWWLRSNGINRYFVSYVYEDGDVLDYGYSVDEAFGVRPALIISNLKSLNLNIGDELKVNDNAYTVISDDMIICRELIGSQPFNKYRIKGNEYETSDIRQFVNKWAGDQGFKTKQE